MGDMRQSDGQDRGDGLGDKGWRGDGCGGLVGLVVEGLDATLCTRRRRELARIEQRHIGRAGERDRGPWSAGIRRRGSRRPGDGDRCRLGRGSGARRQRQVGQVRQFKRLFLRAQRRMGVPRRRRWLRRRRTLPRRIRRCVPHGCSSWSCLSLLSYMALSALDAYKQRDSSKGPSPFPPPFPANHPRSHRPLQGRRQCPHHEAELLQDHLQQQIPGCHPVPPQGTRLAAHRAPRESARSPHAPAHPAVYLCQSRLFPRPRRHRLQSLQGLSPLPLTFPRSSPVSPLPQTAISSSTIGTRRAPVCSFLTSAIARPPHGVNLCNSHDHYLVINTCNYFTMTSEDSSLSIPNASDGFFGYSEEKSLQQVRRSTTSIQIQHISLLR